MQSNFEGRDPRFSTKILAAFRKRLDRDYQNGEISLTPQSLKYLAIWLFTNESSLDWNDHPIDLNGNPIRNDLLYSDELFEFKEYLIFFFQYLINGSGSLYPFLDGDVISSFFQEIETLSQNNKVMFIDETKKDESKYKSFSVINKNETVKLPDQSLSAKLSETNIRDLFSKFIRVIDRFLVRYINSMLIIYGFIDIGDPESADFFEKLEQSFKSEYDFIMTLSKLSKIIKVKYPMVGDI